MTYAIEAREDTNKTNMMLRVVEMLVLRTIAGKTRRDHVTNTDITSQCDVQDLVRWGTQRRGEWYNHISENNTEACPESTDHLEEEEVTALNTELVSFVS